MLSFQSESGSFDLAQLDLSKLPIAIRQSSVENVYNCCRKSNSRYTAGHGLSSQQRLEDLCLDIAVVSPVWLTRATKTREFFLSVGHSLLTGRFLPI